MTDIPPQRCPAVPSRRALHVPAAGPLYHLLQVHQIDGETRGLLNDERLEDEEEMTQQPFGNVADGERGHGESDDDARAPTQERAWSQLRNR